VSARECKANLPNRCGRNAHTCCTSNNDVAGKWQARDSVRAKLRNLVRRALRKWKYPPDGADEAIELCLKQAEALNQSWST